MNSDPKRTYIQSHEAGIYERYVKRAMDLVLASGALIILSPVIGATAVAVRIKMGTPVIFAQDRPGRHCQIFKIYKFRTMKDIWDQDGKLIKDELRMTDFGKKLRATSVDELPELINIIKGDMAIVGPRPLLVKYLPRYTEEELRRHDVRPGITGLAQINGRNAISWEERFEWDLRYIDKITFLGDLKIILKTIGIVCSRKGITSATSPTMDEFKGTKKREPLC